jgi:serine/threonine protein phosphatase PrpC
LRKENSSFNISFISQPGVGMLHNNDYYGCSELEGFACYVVADGLGVENKKGEDPSARVAVEAVISAFNESPSIKKGALRRYLREAHRALSENTGNKNLRATVTVVVTDYQRLRHGHAGNSRFNLYRSGKLIEESRDHSYSLDLVDENKLHKDKVAAHAERHNLTQYCGIAKSFKPKISKRIKLLNADIFTLFTRGIWENAHTSDIMAAIKAGENDPAETTRHLERLILDKVPHDGKLDNYTACFVFVDKIFVDPDAKKRRKKIIIICIIVFLVIAIVVVALILYFNWRNRTEDSMRMAKNNGIEHIRASNFIRAGEELQTAMGLAERLRMREYISNINNHIILTTSIIHANSLLDERRYEQAVHAFRAVAIQSRYADNLALDYISARTERASGYMNVHEYIYLGDVLLRIMDFSGAETMYLSARNLASRFHYIEGRRLANEALATLHDLREQDIAAERQIAQAQAQEELTAAQFLAQGDNALLNEDFVAAMMFFGLARDKYVQLGNDIAVSAIDMRMNLGQLRMAQAGTRQEEASVYERIGDEMLARGLYVEAVNFYLRARDIFSGLGEHQRVRELQSKIDLVDIHIALAAIAVPYEAVQEPDIIVESEPFEVQEQEYVVVYYTQPEQSDQEFFLD